MLLRAPLTLAVPRAVALAQGEAEVQSEAEGGSEGVKGALRVCPVLALAQPLVLGATVAHSPPRPLSSSGQVVPLLRGEKVAPEGESAALTDGAPVMAALTLLVLVAGKVGEEEGERLN